MKKLDQEINSIKGLPIKMSFPSREDIERETEKNGNGLPNETIRNVLLNCLINYAVKDRKEVFLINMASQWIMSDVDDEPVNAVKDFLIHHVLPQMTFTEKYVDGKKEVTGIYMAWIMMQVYKFFGFNDDTV